MSVNSVMTPFYTYPEWEHSYDIGGGVEEENIVLEGPDMHNQPQLPSFVEGLSRRIGLIVPKNSLLEADSSRIELDIVQIDVFAFEG